MRPHTVVDTLLMAGADVDGHGWVKATILSTAVACCSQAVAEMLPNPGKTVDARSFTAFTTFLTAAICGHNTMAEILLNVGANVNTVCRDEPQHSTGRPKGVAVR